MNKFHILIFAVGVSATGLMAQSDMPAVTFSFGGPLNTVTADPQKAAESPMDHRMYSEKPAASVSPVFILAKEKPKGSVEDMKILGDVPGHFPFAWNQKDGERSVEMTDTYLTVKQSYMAKFDAARSQVFTITAPVYYDDRYLQLNAADQRLMTQLEGELRSLLGEMSKLSDRAEQLSKDLAALYARGRPTKLLKNFIPMPAYGTREGETTPYQAPLLHVMPPKIEK